MLRKLYQNPRPVLNPESPGLMKNVNRRLNPVKKLKNRLDGHSLSQTYLHLEFIEPRLEELLSVKREPHGSNLFLPLIIERQ